MSCIKWSFPLSLSKALGCKRVHDDRIAGVTFEGNASRNALIVNEEYAWVGNPFSAPEEGRSRKVLPSFRMPVHEGTRHKRPQNAPSRGRGDVSKKWRGALVLRLRILLSGRADGQSIESSSSALPPSFRFPFLALFLAPYFGSVVSLCEAQGRGRTLLRFCREQLFVWGCFGVSAVLGPGITPRPKIRERRCPFRRRNRSICRFRRSRC